MSKLKMYLELDIDDAQAVEAAITMREKFIAGIPDGESNREGAVIAEICRGWMEMIEAVGNRRNPAPE